MKYLATIVALMLLIGSANANTKGDIMAARVVCISPAHIEMLIHTTRNEEFMEFLNKAVEAKHCYFNPMGGEVVYQERLKPNIEDKDGDLYAIIAVLLKVGDKVSTKTWYTWKHLGRGV